MSKEEKFRSFKFDVNGMKCSSCVSKIEEKLLPNDGIEKVNVDLENDYVYVEFDRDKTNTDEIKSYVADLGYSVDNNGSEKNNGNIKKGIFYGLVPHIGCIAFLLGSVVGVAFLMNTFRPLLMNRYIFHFLIVLSLIFATFSSLVYLKKNDLLSFSGIKYKWKYLTTMYGFTIGINLLLFFIIFPAVATTSTVDLDGLEGFSRLNMDVDIPCPGHAPLITHELEEIEGVEAVGYSNPNNFDVYFDNSETNNEDMMSLEVFKEYEPTIIEEETVGVSDPEMFDGSSVDEQEVNQGCGCAAV